MALFTRESRCPLCDELLGDAQIVATSHFMSDRSDPLWRYSDAAMHRECFLRWPLRAAFVERFNQVVGPMVFGNGTSHRMLEDGQIVVERKS